MGLNDIPDIDFDEVIVERPLKSEDNIQKINPISIKFNTLDVVKPNHKSETVMSVRESEGPDDESNQDGVAKKFFAVETHKSLVTIKEEDNEETMMKENNFMSSDNL